MAFTGQKLTISGAPDELLPVASPTGGDPTSVATFVAGSQVMSGTSSGLAVTQTGPAKSVNTPVTFAMSPYTVLSPDIVIMCATSGGAISIVLPTAVSSANRTIRVMDASGSAATNNVTVTVSGGGTISGAANYVINSAYGTVGLISNGSVWYVTDKVAAAASSSVLTLIETKTLSSVNSVTFSGLDGDTQLVYFLQGQVLFNTVGSTARLTLRPNAASTNFKTALLGNSTAGGGPYTSTSTAGFLLHGLFKGNAAQVQFNGYLNASSTFVTNGRRTWAGVAAVYNNTGPDGENWQSSGVWTVDAAGNNMTSLQAILDDPGVTMSGSISLYRLSRT